MLKYKDRHEMEKANVKMKDKYRTIAKVEGSWLSQILIGTGKEKDMEEVWSMKDKNIKPERARPVDNPLPFDWRYREDLIYVKYNDYKKAGIWKHKLEE